MAMRSVREAAFDVLREYGLTSLFANPGSTEINLLADLPDDLRFVLALHESSVVGMATGWALGRDAPALAILHTTPGLGNAVAALATARVNRAPLVVLVGQQDRRHLAFEPFLAGRLHGLAGEYPVWVDQPVRAQDVPGAIARACHEAVTAGGPALVIVPMDDWPVETDGTDGRAAPKRVVRGRDVDPTAVSELAELVAGAVSPAMVVGAGCDDREAWDAAVALAEHLACPVWQESFSGRAGFPQDHPHFVGHLPADRERLRETLAGHDVVLAVGAPTFRQYPYVPGPFVQDGTRVAMISTDPAEAHRSSADLAVLASPASVCAELVRLVPARHGAPPDRPAPPPSPGPPADGEPLRAGHVLAAAAERLARNAVVIEEAPSNRPELLARLPAREPLGSLSPAMGGLGFALPAATGLRMARPDRPVVAFVGDGASLYAIQSLWSAAHYGVGALYVVFSNGGYAVMDRLVEQHGGEGPWPGFGVDVTGLARAFGCPARTVREHGELLATFDEVLPGLGERDEPLLLEVVVAPDESFAP
ncbi:MAG TPA: thiamine pyrophosphate-dependent enzyme [Gaiellaceae bacterium]|jgi:benzoylformate decarboxylase